MNANPGNVDLKQRLHNEYLKAAIGNKKVKNQSAIGNNLLNQVKAKYEDILQANPNKKNVQRQLEKVNRLINWNAESANPHNNNSLKNYKKQQREKFKKRFSTLTDSQIDNKLSQLLNKPASVNRKKHIRELYHISIKRLRKSKNFTLAFNKALALYNFDKQDPFSLKQIRELSKFTKNYDTQIIIETHNNQQKNNFWSALSLFDVHFRKIEELNLPANNHLVNQLQSVGALIDDPVQNFEYEARKIKLEILKGNLDAVRPFLLNVIKNKSGINSSHTIDRVNILAAKYFKKANQKENFDKIMGIAISPKSFMDDQNEMIKNIALMNLNRSYDKPVHIQNLQRQINKIA